MKFLRKASLLVLAAALAFGSAGMAWGAVTISNITNGITQGNMGAISGTSANVYYYGSNPPQITIALNVAGDIETNSDSLTVSADRAISAIVNATSTATASFTTEADFTIAAQAAGTTSLPVVITVTDETTLNTDTTTLTLNYVKITPTLTAPGTTASMDFYVGAGATQRVTVGATPASASSASFDLSVNPASWSGATGATVAASSRDVSITTLNTTPATSNTSFDVSASAIKIAADNSALVAGLGTGVNIGTFTAQISAFNITLSPTSVALQLGALISADTKSVDITVTPVTANPTYTIAYGGAAAAAQTVKGITVGTNNNKVVISGTPTSADTYVFSVIGTQSGVSVSKNLTVTVNPYILSVSPASVTKSLDDIFAQTLNVSVSPSATLSGLLVAYGSNSAAASQTWNGLTIAANVVSNEITVKGSAAERGSQDFTVSATSAAGTVSSAVFTVTVTAGTTYGLVLKDAQGSVVPSVVPLVDADFDQTLNVSVSPAVDLTSLTVAGSATWNNLTVTADLATKTIRIKGRPGFSGYHDFTINATSATKVIAPANLRAIVRDGAEDGLILDTNSTVGVLLYDQGAGQMIRYSDSGTTTNFKAGRRYQANFQALTVLQGLTVALKGPNDIAYRTLVLGTDYTLDPTLLDMMLRVNVNPVYTGEHSVLFTYTYGSMVGHQQTITLYATEESGDNGNGGSSGCSSFGLGFAALGLCLTGLLRKKR